MNKSDFEGSAILEKLAEIDKLDDFYEAIDSDDFKRARQLLRQAGVDSAAIEIVLRKMAEADGSH